MKNNKTRTIIAICLLAGTLDAIAAILIGYKASPQMVFQYIASGWFGKDAFSGGTPMVVWGILFHYLIASVWSILLFFLYPDFARRLQNKYVIAIVFGVIIWLIMNRLVLPLTNVPRRTSAPSLLSISEGLAAHILCVGLPVSLLSSRYYRREFLKRTLD